MMFQYETINYKMVFTKLQYCDTITMQDSFGGKI